MPTVQHDSTCSIINQPDLPCDDPNNDRHDSITYEVAPSEAPPEPYVSPNRLAQQMPAKYPGTYCTKYDIRGRLRPQRNYMHYTFFPREVVDDLLRMGACQLLRPLPSHDLQRQVRVGDVCFDGDEQSPIVSARVTHAALFADLAHLYQACDSDLVPECAPAAQNVTAVYGDGFPRDAPVQVLTMAPVAARRPVRHVRVRRPRKLYNPARREPALICSVHSDFFPNYAVAANSPAASAQTAPLRAPHAAPLHVPYAPLTGAAVAATTELDSELPDEGVVERVVADARRRARARGSGVVTARDIRDSATSAVGISQPMLSPSDAVPEHIDLIQSTLAQIRGETLELSGGGVPPPRVLVVGERSGVVARMFKQAGADVATCDLEPSECKEIPHFQGDAAYIQDLGWDLVICHPPCTYLANSGLTWLYSDPDRWQHLIANAALFRRLYAARAPYVAVENSKMHRYGRALVGQIDPSQYVHPWQHGTGHTKPTALYLRNLPALKPTCVVDGREAALAKLPPSENRSQLRSRTYQGIAAAMAMQWMPTLLAYANSTPVEQRTRTAEEMIRLAAATTEERYVQLLMTHRSEIISVVAHDDDGGLTRAPTLKVTTSPDAAARELLNHHLEVPSTWKEALTQAVGICPEGHKVVQVRNSDESAPPRIIHVWVINTSEMGSDALPVERQADASQQIKEYDWAPLDDLQLPWTTDARDAAWYRQTVREACKAPVDLLVPSRQSAAVVDHELEENLPPSTRPWLVDKEDPPPAPPTPTHIRRRFGYWMVWTHRGGHTNMHDQYEWQRLTPDLQDRLNQHVGLPAAILPRIRERGAKRAKDARDLRADIAELDDETGWDSPRQPRNGPVGSPPAKTDDTWANSCCISLVCRG